MVHRACLLCDLSVCYWPALMLILMHIVKYDVICRWYVVDYCLLLNGCLNIDTVNEVSVRVSMDGWYWTCIHMISVWIQCDIPFSSHCLTEVPWPYRAIVGNVTYVQSHMIIINSVFCFQWIVVWSTEMNHSYNGAVKYIIDAAVLGDDSYTIHLRTLVQCVNLYRSRKVALDVTITSSDFFVRPN